MSAALTPSERHDLQNLEGIVQRGIDTFLEVGRALAEIRDRRLYRATHRTFEEYCGKRWLLNRTSAYRLIDAAAVEAALSPIGDMPANEAQARELAPLLREDEQAVVEIWRALRERHGDRVTAQLVKVEVEQRLARPDKVCCPGCGRRVLARRIDAPRRFRPGVCRRCGNKLSMEKEISFSTPYEVNTERTRPWPDPRSVKGRLESLAARCSAYPLALPEMRIERAVAGATEEEITGWIEVIRAGADALNKLAARLEAHRERRQR